MHTLTIAVYILKATTLINFKIIPGLVVPILIAISEAESSTYQV